MAVAIVVGYVVYKHRKAAQVAAAAQAADIQAGLAQQNTGDFTAGGGVLTNGVSGIGDFGGSLATSTNGGVVSSQPVGTYKMNTPIDSYTGWRTSPLENTGGGIPIGTMSGISRTTSGTLAGF